MLRRVGALHLFASLFAAIVTATSASANLPDILSGPKNTVPECVTPGRLMAYLKTRNPQLDPRYDAIATEYMRQGRNAWPAMGFCLLSDDRRDRRLELLARTPRRRRQTCAEQFRRSRRHRQRRAGRKLRGPCNGRASPSGAPAALRWPAGRQPRRAAHAQRERLGRAHRLASDLHAADHVRRHVDPLGAIQDVRHHAQAGCRPLPSRDLRSARSAARPCSGGAPAVGQGASRAGRCRRTARNAQGRRRRAEAPLRPGAGAAGHRAGQERCERQTLRPWRPRPAGSRSADRSLQGAEPACTGAAGTAR